MIISINSVAISSQLSNKITANTRKKVQSIIMQRQYVIAGISGVALVGVMLGGCNPLQPEEDTLTIYSGRGEDLIGPLIQQAEEDLGFNIEVRYGDTAELATTIMEEGENSPADLFFGQDAGALGALKQEGRTVTIPSEILNKVDSRFRDEDGQWMGITGRSRVVAYNENQVDEDELPDSVWDLTSEEYRGRVGWAPTNGSFQAFVTAMRLVEGDERTKQWLEDMNANDPQVYSNNTTTVEAIGRGEVDMGLVNNYYLFRFLADDPDFPVQHHYTRGDAASMVNIAGVSVLDTADDTSQAFEFINYLVSEESQTFFAAETKEYPLIPGMEPPADQLELDEIDPPEIDLGNLEDLEGTLSLLQEAGVL